MMAGSVQKKDGCIPQQSGLFFKKNFEVESTEL